MKFAGYCIAIKFILMLYPYNFNIWKLKYKSIDRKYNIVNSAKALAYVLTKHIEYAFCCWNHSIGYMYRRKVERYFVNDTHNFLGF